jgi:hypothetical protein
MKSKKDVAGFAYMTKKKSIATVIDIVEVKDEAGNLSCLKSVLDILRCTTYISCLSLEYSFPPALRRLPTGHGQVFRNLTSLTTNVPHSSVAAFLVVHPQIRFLPQLEQLTIPPGCVLGLLSAGSGLRRLITVHGSRKDANYPLPRLLNSLYAFGNGRLLTILHLEFHQLDTMLLQRISVVAPCLIVLRLTESFFTFEVRQLVCDTDDCLMKQIVQEIAMGRC